MYVGYLSYVWCAVDWLNSLFVVCLEVFFYFGVCVAFWFCSVGFLFLVGYLFLSFFLCFCLFPMFVWLCQVFCHFFFLIILFWMFWLFLCAFSC